MSDKNKKQLISVVGGALECSSDELGDYLTKACKGDTAFKDRVLQLLEAHQRTDDFLETPLVRLSQKN